MTGCRRSAEHIVSALRVPAFVTICSRRGNPWEIRAHLGSWGRWAGLPGAPGRGGASQVGPRRSSSLLPPQLSHCGLVGRWPYLKTGLPHESPRPACPATANLRQVPPALLEKFPGAHRFGVLRKEGPTFLTVWRYPGSPRLRKISLCLLAQRLSFHLCLNFPWDCKH